MSNAIEKLPQKKLAAMAMNMRRRARNEAMNKQIMFKRVLNIGVGGGAAWAMGGYMADKQKEFMQLAATKGPEEAKKNDPRQIAGIDTEIVVGGLASIGGVLLQGKSGTRFWGELGESAGLGVLCFYAGKKGFDDRMKQGSAFPGAPETP